MDFRKVNRLTSSPCIACRYAGSHVVFWPREPITQRDKNGMYGWHGYINCHEKVRALRSTHGQFGFCEVHYDVAFESWVRVAKAEVELEKAWYNYLEKMSR